MNTTTLQAPGLATEANPTNLATPFNPVMAVYPGHPITLAVTVMQAYASLESALERSASDGFKAALTNSAVAGARGPLNAALGMLHTLQEGVLSVEEVFQWADNYWYEETNHGYERQYAEGLNQAHTLQPLFRQLLTRWIPDRTA